MWTNSLDTAQDKTGTITAAMLLAMIKRGTDAPSLFFEPCPNRESYQDACIVSIHIRRKSLPPKDGWSVREQADLPGAVRGGFSSETREGPYGLDWAMTPFRPSRGHWYLLGCEDRLREALSVLPSRAEVAFEVNLDDQTHSGMAAHGMHADVLYLVARWRPGKDREHRTVRFMIDVRVGLHNTARFGAR